MERKSINFYELQLPERMIKMIENNEVKKKRIKTTKTEIAGRIIAALMVVFMLVASCSTVLYFLFNA